MSAMPPIPEPEVIVRKLRAKSHAAHHGGAWKVAYADFVTAMMAFFLMLWLLGATDDEQRKGIADYFAPSILASDKSGGSNGLLAGRSIEQPDGVAPHAQRAGMQPTAPFQAATGGRAPRSSDDGQLRKIESEIRSRMERDPGLKDLATMVRFVHTPEGLRIELIDSQDYSMFGSGNASMDPRARQVLSIVADAIRDVPNRLAVRGHTDSVPFSREDSLGPSNNWTLSAARAEATRQALARAGIPESRFSRLEGVADTEPFVADNPNDPRNRRMSVTLLRSI
ncbi:MAG: flagellar motor protein MotB [Thermaurantiacus sp.]